MKLIKGIMGCALAAGLMTFAADKSKAVVIDNTLYTPVNIMLTVSYHDAKTGSLKQYSVTSKEVLKALGLPKGDQIALRDYEGDVYLINKTTVLEDLTTAGYVTMNFSDTLDNEINGKKDDGSYKYAEAGILNLDVYSDPQFSEGLDQGASEEASDEWFEISGFYTYNETGSKFDKNDNRNISVTIKASALSGTGADANPPKNQDVPNPTTVTGSTSSSGSGKVEDL